MRDTTLMQQALGLTPPWTVVRSDFDAEAHRLDVQIDLPTPNSEDPYFLWREADEPEGRAEDFGLKPSSRAHTASHRRRISWPS